VTDYLDFITDPIDLSTMEKRIYRGDWYKNHYMLYTDMNTMANNCKSYNGEGSVFYNYAVSLEVYLGTIFPKSVTHPPPNDNIASPDESFPTDSLVVERLEKSLKSCNVADSTTTADATCDAPLSGGGDSCHADNEHDDDGDYKLKDRQEGGRKKRGRGNSQKCTAPPKESEISTSHTRRVRLDLDLVTPETGDYVEPLQSNQSRTNRAELLGLGGFGLGNSPRRMPVVSDSPSILSSSDDYSIEETSSKPCQDSLTTSERTPNESSIELRKMKVGRIIAQISGGLPEVAAILLKDDSVAGGTEGFKVVFSSVASLSDIENDYLDQPIGRTVREYSREKTSMGICGSGGIPYISVKKGGPQKSAVGRFILTLADVRTDKDARKYHDEVEMISPWFIEIASCVRVGRNGGVEASGAYWKVLYLFEKHSHSGTAKYSLVGYVTLLYDDNHMSVCQAVCLPPYQRNGHGTEMLKTAYDICDSREILVESPAPAFGELNIV
jgi:hypothetical protein